jgi:hypothetical protein
MKFKTKQPPKIDTLPIVKEEKQKEKTDIEEPKQKKEKTKKNKQ